MLRVTWSGQTFRLLVVEPCPLGVDAGVLCGIHGKPWSAYVDCSADDAYLRLRRLFDGRGVFPVADDAENIAIASMFCGWIDSTTELNLSCPRTPFVEHLARCKIQYVSQVHVAATGWASFMRTVYDAGLTAKIFRITISVYSVDMWFPVRCPQVLFLCKPPYRHLAEFVSAAVVELLYMRYVALHCDADKLPLVLQNVHAEEFSLEGGRDSRVDTDPHCFSLDLPRVHTLRFGGGAVGSALGVDFTLCPRVAFVLCSYYLSQVYVHLLRTIPTLLNAPLIYASEAPSVVSEMRAYVQQLAPLLLCHFDSGVVDWSPRVHRVFYKAHNCLFGAFVMMLDRMQEGAVLPEQAISPYDPAAVETVFRHFDACVSRPAGTFTSQISSSGELLE